MKKIITLVTALLTYAIAVSQSVYDVRADSFRVYKNGGFATFVLRNATKDSTNGVLITVGNGVTMFSQALNLRSINAQKNLFIPVYPDTATANINKLFDQIGMIICVRALPAVFYMRDSSAGTHKWSLVGGLSTMLARNGASVDGSNFVTLFNDVGLTNGQLINNRELPMNAKELFFTGMGSSNAGSALHFREASTKTTNAYPFFLFEDQFGNELEAIRMHSTNIGFGALALQSASGVGNVAIGNGAGQNISSGTNNTAIGTSALSSVSTTTQNTAVGSSALSSNASSNNVAVGYSAMSANTGGSNVAIGRFAMSLGTANDNIAIGNGAMNNLTSGNKNVAIGSAAGGNNQAGFGNVTIGDNAGGATLSGTYSKSRRVIIGANAGQQQLVPDCNIIIGYKALFAGSGLGVSNIDIGDSAYATGGWSGDSTINIGSGNAATGGGTSFGSHNIWIGMNGTLSGGAALTNVVVIGRAMKIGNVNNVVGIGRDDQNIVLGKTTITDNGSRVQMPGSVSFPIRTSGVNTTLDATDHTLVLTAGGLTITNPSAASSTNRVYRVVNQAAASTFSVNYLDFTGASVNTIPANGVIMIQSNGTNLYRIQ